MIQSIYQLADTLVKGTKITSLEQARACLMNCAKGGPCHNAGVGRVWEAWDALHTAIGGPDQQSVKHAAEGIDVVDCLRAEWDGMISTYMAVAISAAVRAAWANEGDESRDLAAHNAILALSVTEWDIKSLYGTNAEAAKLEALKKAN